jgi:hypothetical protein
MAANRSLEFRPVGRGQRHRTVVPAYAENKDEFMSSRIVTATRASFEAQAEHSLRIRICSAQRPLIVRANARTRNGHEERLYLSDFRAKGFFLRKSDAVRRRPFAGTGNAIVATDVTSTVNQRRDASGSEGTLLETKPNATAILTVVGDGAAINEKISALSVDSAARWI